MNTEIKGYLTQISGPVVRVKGISNANVGDQVTVGEEKLIGEILESSKEEAVVQVYEDTTGLRPGDKVKGLNRPLSVELGPGLISQTFDGIQRPLKILSEVSGDFISRGSRVNALDREKKWNFNPTIKEGEGVEPLQVIGEVEETELITHKIMIPAGIKGKLIKISDKGQYTIKDEIAKVRTQDDKEISINMFRTWPVRKTRKSGERKISKTPLVTGQRILDFLFPISKGGVAAIPGGFGTGKCMSGDTPVMLGDGSLIPIKKIFQDNHGKGKVVKTRKEEYTKLEKPLKVMSFQEGRFKTNKATVVYKGRTDYTIKIETRTGREVEVTPNHKLHVMTSEMKIVEKKAGEIKKGDFILSPRKLPNPKDNVNLNLTIDNMRVGKEGSEEIQAVLKRFTNKKKLKQIAKVLQEPYHNVIEYKSGRNRPKVEFAYKLQNLIEKKISINKIKAERESKEVKLPKRVTKELAEFLGFLISDGSIINNSIFFYNSDKNLRARFSKLVYNLFGLETKGRYANTVKCVSVSSVVLTKILEEIGVPLTKKSRNARVPYCILSSNRKTIASFLGAYFLCDGCISKYELEITTASKKMGSQLSYLFTRCNMLSISRKKRVKNRVYYRSTISGQEELKKFLQTCKIFPHKKFSIIEDYLSLGKPKFRGIDIVPACSEYIGEKFKKSDKKRQDFKEGGIKLSNYITQRENMSFYIFKKFAKLIKDSQLQSITQNELRHVFCDKVIKKEIQEAEKEVYDLTVPGSNNLVGGEKPLILHNTVTQHQLAKWADADIIIYIGCGERGNEMTQVLEEFPKLEDPRSGRPIIERTVLIANTSNMPVTAREASIYTGITMGEYFRDMGYDVAIMADSTSRWAEALREISGRLEEMPAEQGFPPYLSSRIAEFYERAGSFKLNHEKEGSLSIVGAVSPPGGDFSEPVTQHTKRFTRVFWALDKALAGERHFPAINWNQSYSGYAGQLSDWWNEQVEEVDNSWTELRQKIMKILQEEARLQRVVKLVGPDALPDAQRLTLEIANIIKTAFLQQNAFSEVDSFCDTKKQIKMISLILYFYNKAKELLKKNVPVLVIVGIDVVDDIMRMKETIPNDEIEKIDDFKKQLDKQIQELASKYM